MQQVIHQVRLVTRSVARRLPRRNRSDVLGRDELESPPTRLVDENLGALHLERSVEQRRFGVMNAHRAGLRSADTPAVGRVAFRDRDVHVAKARSRLANGLR